MSDSAKPSFHLVCVHEFHGYKTGQRIEDPGEVGVLLKDREHHFVKVTAPVVETPAPSASEAD